MLFLPPSMIPVSVHLIQQELGELGELVPSFLNVLLASNSAYVYKKQNLIFNISYVVFVLF